MYRTNRFTKVIISTLVLVMVMSLLPVAALAAQDSSTDFIYDINGQGNMVNAQAGETVEMTIYLPTNLDVMGYYAGIKTDPNTMTVVSTEKLNPNDQFEVTEFPYMANQENPSVMGTCTSENIYNTGDASNGILTIDLRLNDNLCVGDTLVIYGIDTANITSGIGTDTYFDVLSSDYSTGDKVVAEITVVGEPENTEAVDFLYDLNCGGNTIEAQPGEIVELTVFLPQQTDVSGYYGGVKTDSEMLQILSHSEPKVTGARWENTYTPYGYNDANPAAEGSCLSDYVFNTGDELRPILSVSMQVSETAAAGDTIYIYGVNTANISKAKGTETYFDVKNSDYSTGDKVVAAIRVLASEQVADTADYADTPENDFVYDLNGQGNDILAKAGDTVTVTISLPTNLNVVGYYAGIKTDPETMTIVERTFPTPANGTWSASYVSYLFSKNNPAVEGGCFDSAYDTGDTNQPIFIVTMTLSDELQEGEELKIYGIDVANISGMNRLATYFDCNNSSYAAGNKVIGTIHIYKPTTTLTAKDVILTAQEAADMTESQLLTMIGATLTSSDDSQPEGTCVIDAQQLAALNSACPGSTVTVTVADSNGDAAPVDVNVTILDTLADVSTSAKHDFALEASAFCVKQSVTSAEDILACADVQVYDANMNPVDAQDRYDIHVNADDTAALAEAENGDTVSLRIIATDTTDHTDVAQITVEVEVLSDDAALSADSKNYVEGSDCEADADNLNKLTAGDVLTLASAKTVADGQMSITEQSMSALLNAKLGDVVTVTIYAGTPGAADYVEKQIQVAVKKTTVDVYKFDYNRNGTVDSADILAMRKLMANVTIATGLERDFFNKAFDDNDNGVIDSADILVARKQMAKVVDMFTVEMSAAMEQYFPD